MERAILKKCLRNGLTVSRALLPSFVLSTGGGKRNHRALPRKLHLTTGPPHQEQTGVPQWHRWGHLKNPSSAPQRITVTLCGLMMGPGPQQVQNNKYVSVNEETAYPGQAVWVRWPGAGLGCSRTACNKGLDAQRLWMKKELNLPKHMMGKQ